MIGNGIAVIGHGYAKQSGEGMEKQSVGMVTTSEAKHRQSEAWKDGQRQGKVDRCEGKARRIGAKAGRRVARLW